MNRWIRILQSVLIISIIPILIYGYLVYTTDLFASEGELFPGLANLGAIILFFLFLFVDLVLLVVTQLVYHVLRYRKNCGTSQGNEKSGKGKIAFYGCILLIVVLGVAYYPVQSFVSQTTSISVEPTEEEIRYLVSKEPYLSLNYSESDYTLKNIELSCVNDENQIFYYTAKIRETNEVINITIRKFYDINNLTRIKGDTEVILLGMSVD